MRKMNDKEKKFIENEIRIILSHAISNEYVNFILEHTEEENGNTFAEDVIDDVMCSSAWDDEGYYNDDDIRLSIGRVLIDRLRIDY